MLLPLLALFLLPAPLCARQSGSPLPELGRASGPVLRVNGEDVSGEEYSRWLIENFGAKLATTFAGDWLIQKDARRRGVAASPEEIAAELDRELKLRIDGAFLGSKEGWLAELARTQRTESGLRAQRSFELELELLTRKSAAIDRVVPEEKIVREWELSYGRHGRAYELSMLLVRCEFESKPAPEPPPERETRRLATVEAKRKVALALRERISKGEDFAAVAREASDDELSRAAGGRPPQGYRHFGWPKNFLDELETLRPGELSQPVYAKGGWWIVRIERSKETPLESVRAELVQRLEARGPEQDETGRFRNALVEAAEIDVLPTLFADPDEDLEQAALLPGLSIGGETISRGTYARWIQRTRGEASWPHFVEHRVVLDEARRRGVTVTPADVRARSEEYLGKLILRDHQGNREAWLAAMSLRSTDIDLFMHDLDVRMRIELFCERLILLDRKVTPEAVRQRFESLYGKDGVALQVRMILLNVPIAAGPPGETREQLAVRLAAAQEAVRKRAQGLARTVRDGGDFAALARANSEDAESAVRGGALDARFRAELWPESIAKEVAALPDLGVTDPLQFGSAYVVLQVYGRERIEFERVAEELAAQMRSEAPPRAELNLYRNTLVRQAKLEVLDGMNR